jgi:hypothetical protein
MAVTQQGADLAKDWRSAPLARPCIGLLGLGFCRDGPLLVTLPSVVVGHVGTDRGLKRLPLLHLRGHVGVDDER